MRLFFLMTGATVAISAALLAVMLAMAAKIAPQEREASPVYGVRIPAGYRAWELVAPAQEAPPLDELRAVLANRAAMRAYRTGTLPFPDGSVLVKLAWRHEPSSEFAPASVPGAATTVQVMVKDSKRYRASGGWGFGRFVDGRPVDREQHETCFACHQASVRNHDFVFTRLAP